MRRKSEHRRTPSGEILYCPLCGKRMKQAEDHDGVCEKCGVYADWNERKDMIIVSTWEA